MPAGPVWQTPEPKKFHRRRVEMSKRFDAAPLICSPAIGTFPIFLIVYEYRRTVPPSERALTVSDPWIAPDGTLVLCTPEVGGAGSFDDPPPNVGSEPPVAMNTPRRIARANSPIATDRRDLSVLACIR
jgi:hypothetical protein